jgi:hypothetical protein
MLKARAIINSKYKLNNNEFLPVIEIDFYQNSLELGNYYKQDSLKEKIIHLPEIDYLCEEFLKDEESIFKKTKEVENNEKNRDYFAKLIEKALDINNASLKINVIKSYYWNIGTHYYKPLNNIFFNRNNFIKIAQHPMDCMLVVGEAVSKDQGWVEGALNSVQKVLTKNWIESS